MEFWRISSSACHHPCSKIDITTKKSIPICESALPLLKKPLRFDRWIISGWETIWSLWQVFRFILCRRKIDHILFQQGFKLMQPTPNKVDTSPLHTTPETPGTLARISQPTSRQVRPLDKLIMKTTEFNLIVFKDEQKYTI